LSRRTLAIAVAVAVVEVAAALALVLTSDHEDHKAATAALALTALVSFVAAGLLALYRRPENRTGVYLAAVGYLWFFAALSEANDDVVFTLGAWLGNLAFIPFAALVLAFPTGRLAPRPDRLIVRLTAAFVLVGPPMLLLFAKHPQGCGASCGSSAIVVVESPRTETIVNAVGTACTVALIAAVLVLLVRRWRRATPALRRVLGPVYLAGGGALVFLLLSNALSQVSTGAADAIGPFFLVLFAAVPFAFLLGILRSRLARGSVAGLVVAIGQGTPLRDAIADALGDPTLELAYWLEENRRFVDREGHRFQLPAPASGRTATVVEHDGRRIGALVHDESLDDEPVLLDSVSATVALALDNERLETELRAQYEFLTTIVDTAPSLLVSIDAEGRIRNLNPATVAASGYDSEEEVRGRFFWDVFIDEWEREAVLERFRAAAPGHPPAEYENAFTNARGDHLVIAWRSAPVLDESGNVVRIVAGGLDVTDRKRQEEELRASRLRIVTAGDEARRRLERNLHDGAQQRLVTLALALRLAESKAATDPDGAATILRSASEELGQALAELRELARGIHPAVLTDRGLNAALEGLAARTPLPVELSLPDERLPEQIEAAAYYVVSEALANVVKHAQATAVDVRVAAVEGTAVIEVADDGVGGADAGGSGLRGLIDRVAALDGRLRVESPERGGTRIVAEVPVAPAVRQPAAS
jgi:PAS domain S-box-containing protein